MRFALHLVCLGLGLELFACGDGTTTTTTVERPQLVAVQPSDFLLGVSCGPNGVRSYVATLFDVTPGVDGTVPKPGVQLPSSPATSCLVPVTFSLVKANHSYLAAIDGYDREPAELTPQNSGERSQVDPSQNLVAPGWTATCGGYPPSVPNGTAGGSGTDLPGVVAYAELTQTPHNCGEGLVVPSADAP